MCLCQCVCLCVSVTSRYCIETAARIMLVYGIFCSLDFILHCFFLETSVNKNMWVIPFEIWTLSVMLNASNCDINRSLYAY